MSAVRIKKGDTVKVIAGKDKGKEGKVLSVNAKNHTALVEGVNMVTKHVKPKLNTAMRVSIVNMASLLIFQISSEDDFDINRGNTAPLVRG